jgi:hypothetical protein
MKTRQFLQKTAGLTKPSSSIVIRDVVVRVMPAALLIQQRFFVQGDGPVVVKIMMAQKY